MNELCDVCVFDRVWLGWRFVLLADIIGLKNKLNIYNLIVGIGLAFKNISYGVETRFSSQQLISLIFLHNNYVDSKNTNLTL